MADEGVNLYKEEQEKPTLGTDINVSFKLLLIGAIGFIASIGIAGIFLLLGLEEIGFLIAIIYLGILNYTVMAYIGIEYLDLNDKTIFTTVRLFAISFSALLLFDPATRDGIVITMAGLILQAWLFTKISVIIIEKIINKKVRKWKDTEKKPVKKKKKSAGDIWWKMK